MIFDLDGKRAEAQSALHQSLQDKLTESDANVKELTEMVHGITQSMFRSRLPNTRFDYAGKVGSGLGSNVIMAPILWISRAMPEAFPIIKSGDDTLDEHPTLSLIAQPNKEYSGDAMNMGLILSFCLDGNGYLSKVNPGNGVKELWYIPHWLIEPKWESGDFITAYKYTPEGGRPIFLPPEDIIHFRNGIDPRNVRKGLSPIFSALREIFTDDEAANYTAAILKNMGFPGMMIAPDTKAVVNPDSMDQTKQYIQERFSGDHRGEPMVMGAPTTVTTFGFSPEQMNVSSLRNMSEERVCALLGIPAAVVGFGSGMEQTKVGATMTELRKLAWTNGIMPILRSFAATYTQSLLPDMDSRPKLKLSFDTSGVMSLQEDKANQAKTLSSLVSGGLMTIAEARERLGLDVDDSHQIFLRPFNLIEVPVGQSAPPLPGSTDNDDDEDKAMRGKNRKRIGRRQQTIAIAMERNRRALEIAFEKKMLDFLARYAEEVESAVKRLGIKADQEELDIEVLFQTMAIDPLKSEIRGIYGAHFVSVHDSTTNVLAGLGLNLNVPDTFQIEMLALGGKKARLVDFTEGAKRRATAALRDARAEGLGVDEVARRLKNIIPAGKFQTTGIRSKIMARTETLFAQNASSLRSFRSIEGVDGVVILDARLGETDAFCEGINGNIVDFAEAQFLMDEEHPNGTRSFAPVFGGVE